MGEPTTRSATSASESLPRGDEVTPIVKYMVREMIINADSHWADKIRDLNRRNMRSCVEVFKELPLSLQLRYGATVLGACGVGVMSSKVFAMGIWGWLVREDGDWDHKPDIKTLFKPANPKGNEQHWHHYNGYLYYYDIWSNIHYGYVGKACGFSSGELLDGAGVEQIGSDVWNMRFGNVLTNFGDLFTKDFDGMRHFDDPRDRAAISMGIHLYPREPGVNELLRLVQTTPGLSRKPLR